jgi:hypothetical protein
MDSLIIQLGKTSEVMALLPLAYAGHQANLRVGMMVCREFADCLDGASYVEKVVFDGQPWQLPEAVEQARKLSQEVVVTQVNGPKEVIAKYAYSQIGRTQAVESSFDRESWNVAGALNAWGKFPLVFDQRNAEREQSLLPANHRGKAALERKLALLALDSVTSPFLNKDQLRKLLTLNCPNFEFVDLCQVRAERFYDLLGLYEAAHCLISVDTAHLHLAPAVPTLPVMALIQDAPDYWHGTAWRPQHHFYCRYHDVSRRAMELFTAINRLGRQESPAILAYHGGLRDDGWTSFAIQPGSCHRDSANCLHDQAHYPMLRAAIEMFTQTPLPHQTVILVRSDTKFKDYPATASACQASPPRYAYRMNRDQAGHDTFFPAADLFAARVELWKQILPELPDMCMDDGAFWSRALLEVFKMHGAREIEGIYRES